MKLKRTYILETAKERGFGRTLEVIIEEGTDEVSFGMSYLVPSRNRRGTKRVIFATSVLINALNKINTPDFVETTIEGRLPIVEASPAYITFADNGEREIVVTYRYLTCSLAFVRVEELNELLTVLKED